MTKKSQSKKEETQDSTEEQQDDYIAEAHPDQDRDDAIVDEQGEESFPASDPPGNF